MNVGDIIPFFLTSAPADGGGYTYVWKWWDGTVDATTVPSITKQVNMGGTLFMSLTQCDQFGNSQIYNGTLFVNRPPAIIGAPTISNNDGVFPFNTTLTSVAYDPDHPGGVELTFNWVNGSTSLGPGSTTVLSTGTYQNALAVSGVSQNATYTQVITDILNGTTIINYAVRGTAPTGLQGSGSSANSAIISSTNNLGEVIIGPNQTVTFSVFAQDTASGALRFSWTLKAFDGWSADFSVTDSGTRLPNGAFQDSLTRSIANEQPGFKVANCLVTNLSTGQSINIRNTVQLLSAQSPVINNIITDAPVINGALAVSQAGWLHFMAQASDPNGAILSYRWDFTQPANITYYGKTVLMFPADFPEFIESALETGGPRPILGNLTVTDRYGRTDTQPIANFAAVQVWPSTLVSPTTSGSGPGAGQISGGGSGGTSGGGGGGGTTGTMKLVYWGVNANSTLSNGDIAALSSQFQSNRVLSVTLTATAQYLYFVIPSSFGAATFNVNGLLNTAWVTSTITFNSDTYIVYRSQNLLTGTYQVAVS